MRGFHYASAGPFALRDLHKPTIREACQWRTSGSRASSSVGLTRKYSVGSWRAPGRVSTCRLPVSTGSQGPVSAASRCWRYCSQSDCCPATNERPLIALSAGAFNGCTNSVQSASSLRPHLPDSLPGRKNDWLGTRTSVSSLEPLEYQGSSFSSSQPMDRDDVGLTDSGV